MISCKLQLSADNKNSNQHSMTCQRIDKREVQIEDDLAQLVEARVRLTGALIRKGSVTEVVCQKTNSRYCQASRRFTELQEKLEEILGTLHTMESVLEDIKESLRYKQRTRRRRGRQQELEANMEKVDLQLWLISEGEGTDRQFIKRKAKIKQMKQ